MSIDEKSTIAQPLSNNNMSSFLLYEEQILPQQQLACKQSQSACQLAKSACNLAQSAPGWQSATYKPIQPGWQSATYKPIQPGWQSATYKPIKTTIVDEYGNYCISSYSSPNSIYPSFHTTMIPIAIYLSFKCNNGFDFGSFLAAFCCPHIYILYILITKNSSGTCGLFNKN